VQGITGHHGQFHTRLMLKYGTRIVAGVTPGKGGEDVCGVPVFNSVKEALKDHKPVWSVIFVPARFVKKAAIEALTAGLHIVIITEHIPVMDALDIFSRAEKHSLTVIGPNCPGVIVPGVGKLGIIPGSISKEGDIGVVSRSGTLTYELVNQLTKADLGQKVVVGIGGDLVSGFDFVDALKVFEARDDIKRILMVGEIGGDAEECAAEYIKEMKTPVVAYIAGRTVPKGKRMGHAGAIIHGEFGTAASKIKALSEAGVKVCDLPSEVVSTIKNML